MVQKKLPNFHAGSSHDPEIDLSDINVSVLFYNYAESRSLMVPEGYLRDVLGHTPSMSALNVAAILQKYRCNVGIIDAALNDWTCQQTIDELRRRKPDVVGLTICSSDFNLISRKWIQQIKDELGCIIVVGGELATSYPALLIDSEPAIEFVIAGQADFCLGPLLAAWRDKKPVDSIAGIAYRNADGKGVYTGPAKPLKDLDSFPYLPYYLQEYERYITPQARYTHYTGILTTRGCPFACRFCYERVAPYAAMSAKRIVDEMEWAHLEFGMREFDFWDPTFNINAKRVEQFCEELTLRNLNVCFTIRARPDLMTMALLKALKKAGCNRVQYGIESGDENVIKAMNKRGRFQNLNYTRDILKATRKLGMETAGYTVSGLEYQSRNSIEKTDAFLKTLALDYIISLPAYIGPSTNDYDVWREKTGKDFWHDYIVSGEDDLEKLLKTVPQYYSLEERMTFVNRYIRTVYINPRQILKVLWRDIRHPVSFISKIRAGLQIIRMSLFER